jgi:hypothetical protein
VLGGLIVFFKNIESITENDLNDLVENKVFETRTLEYKECFPGNRDSDKKEFLADVSSFANSAGGSIIFGISEKKGIPQEVKGIDNNIIDQEKSRLENMIRDGIAPRITGISINTLHLSSSMVVLIMRIPKSWNSPHCVTYNHHEKFYARNNSGKYKMDIPELRAAFILSETIIDKIKNFREERISKIFSGEAIMPFYDNAKMVLHLIPLSSFDPAKIYDLKKILSCKNQLEPPIKYFGYHNKFNVDGLLFYTRGEEGKSYSYAQFYRNGIIEALEGRSLDPRLNNGEKAIHATAYENAIIETLTKYFHTLQEMNIELPIIIFISFVGVKNYKIITGEGIFRETREDSIDREILFLPEVIIENYDVMLSEILKPSFDVLWNAFDFPGSPNYNEDGKRKIK